MAVETLIPTSAVPDPKASRHQRMMALYDEIRELKRTRNAVILAHLYERLEVQNIADHVGDSLGLSQEATQTDADVIVFCGVHFMAETAKLLSPQKKVFLGNKNAGCPMADMITREELIAGGGLRQHHCRGESRKRRVLHQRQRR
jgi:quinolinate synthase